MSVRAPYSFDTGATFRLTQGRVDVDARGGRFLVESYREVPQSLRLALINMRLSPVGTPSLFNLVFDGDAVTTSVFTGTVEVLSGEVRGTLEAGWQAVLAVDQPLRIISPATPTPTASNTPTPSRTATRTRTPTATPTAPPTATVRIIPPTATPTERPDNGGQPPPTPVPPPTDVPPPTEEPTRSPPTAPP